MSQQFGQRTTNPDAREDAEFTALKGQLGESDEAVTISWEQVFSLDRTSFLPDNAETLAQWEAALEFLESKDYGQQLFQDIILNEDRVQPVAVRADSLRASTPALYQPENDAIVYNTQFYELIELMPEEQQQQAMEMITAIGHDKPEIVLLHEGDHAARIYGADLPELLGENGHFMKDNLIPYNLSIGCFEEHAITRADQFREESGLPPRTDYALIDEQISQAVEVLKGKDEFEEMQRNGVSKNVYNGLSAMFTQFEARNAGCDAPPIEEIETLGKRRAKQLLSGLGIPEITPQDNTSEEKHLSSPDHGLPTPPPERDAGSRQR
jgi:tellurite resistance protein